MTKETRGRKPLEDENDKKESVSVSVSKRHLKALKKAKTTPTEYINTKLQNDYPKPN